MVQVLVEPTCSQMTGVYGPKPFIPHAASLHQACAHCEKFSTAATRRCLDRVSVPVWLVVLSDQLPVLALVGHYPANELIGRGLIQKRQVLRSPALALLPHSVLARLSASYPQLQGRFPRVTHPCATQHPEYCYPEYRVQLACLIHAASVRSEPESNSPYI